MGTFNKIKFQPEMLGADVIVIANDNSIQRGFESGKAYRGKLLDKVDWFVGCPVFSCDQGDLGLGYECQLVESK